MKTYLDLIDALEKLKGNIYVPVFFVDGHYDWLPIDKEKYLHRLKLIGNPEINLPCYVESEDNNLFFHPRVNH